MDINEKVEIFSDIFETIVDIKLSHGVQTWEEVKVKSLVQKSSPNF